MKCFDEREAILKRRVKFWRANSRRWERHADTLRIALDKESVHTGCLRGALQEATEKVAKYRWRGLQELPPLPGLYLVRVKAGCSSSTSVGYWSGDGWSVIGPQPATSGGLKWTEIPEDEEDKE